MFLGTGCGCCWVMSLWFVVDCETIGLLHKTVDYAYLKACLWIQDDSTKAPELAFKSLFLEKLTFCLSLEFHIIKIHYSWQHGWACRCRAKICLPVSVYFVVLHGIFVSNWITAQKYTFEIFVIFFYLMTVSSGYLSLLKRYPFL